jgi:hypothetical protein
MRRILISALLIASALLATGALLLWWCLPTAFETRSAPNCAGNTLNIGREALNGGAWCVD